MNEKKKCGIVTFHSAYNFGSVLQAYATQEYITKLGYDTKIINYRMHEQKKVYSIVRRGEGLKGIIKEIMSLSTFCQRITRKTNFEKFIRDYLNLTEEFADPNYILKIYDQFDIFVSGSDQIWNKHSNELHNVDWHYMYPYLLKGTEKKKISYASSIGNMKNIDELKRLCEEVKEFDHISMRESTGASIIKPFLERDINIVLDPTFLIEREEWIFSLKLNSEQNRKYVLFYSLAGKKTLKKIKNLLYKLIKRGYQIKYITPYNFGGFLKSSNAINCLTYGPREFMNAIYNASMIVTDSYHGTILSLNLEKEVFSINGEYASDYRKTDILKHLGILSHSISWESSIEDLLVNEIDYEIVKDKLELMRKGSLSYLIESLRG